MGIEAQSTEAQQYFADLADLTGQVVPPILSGAPRMVGGEGLTMPVYDMGRRSLRERRGALRRDVLDELAMANSFLRGVLTFVYPDTKYISTQNSSVYSRAVSNVFAFDLPKHVQTGHLDQFSLRAVAVSDFDEALQDRIAPMPETAATPLEAAFILATARFKSGHVGGEIGKVLRVGLRGQRSGEGQPLRFQSPLAITAFPVSLDRNRIASESRHARYAGVATAVRNRHTSSNLDVRSTDPDY